MSDYISRQAAIERINEALSKVFVESSDLGEKILEKIPSADVRENIHGEWRYMNADFAFAWICSECGHASETSHSMFIRSEGKFCSNCGANMRRNNE